MGANDEQPSETGAPATSSSQGAPERELGGLRVSDLLELPEPARRLLTWMLREGEVNRMDVAAGLGWDESTALSVLGNLVAEGLVSENEMGASGQIRYRVRLAHHRARGRGRDLLRRLGETSDD